MPDDPDDPDNLEGDPPTAQERAENWRELQKLHPGNRFRLMLGLPMLTQDEQKPLDPPQPVP